MTDTTSAMPRGYFTLVRDILIEIQKHWQTASNFDDDVKLAIAQTEAALTAPAQADIHATTRACASCGQLEGTQHHSTCAYAGLTSPYVIQSQCKAHPTPPRVDEKAMVTMLADVLEPEFLTLAQLLKAGAPSMLYQGIPVYSALAFGRALMEKCR